MKYCNFDEFNNTQHHLSSKTHVYVGLRGWVVIVFRTSAPKTEVVCFSKMLVPTYKPRCCHNPQDLHRYLPHHNNLKSCTTHISQYNKFINCKILTSFTRCYRTLKNYYVNLTIIIQECGTKKPHTMGLPPGLTLGFNVTAVMLL